MSEVKFLNFEVVELAGPTKEEAYKQAPFYHFRRCNPSI
jgi:hypothetical protein